MVKMEAMKSICCAKVLCNLILCNQLIFISVKTCKELYQI